MLHVDVYGPMRFWPRPQAFQVLSFNANVPGTCGPTLANLVMDWSWPRRTRWMASCVQIMAVRFTTLLCHGEFPELTRRVTVQQVIDLLTNYILHHKVRYHTEGGGYIKFMEVMDPDLVVEDQPTDSDGSLSAE
jgi:hypothetical protein